MNKETINLKSEKSFNPSKSSLHNFFMKSPKVKKESVHLSYSMKYLKDICDGFDHKPVG